MNRHLLISFFLSFFAFVLMLGLYVFLPYYLASRTHDITTLPARGTLTFKNGKAFFPTPLPVPTPTPTPTPTPALTPATLIIPKLEIQAAIENVGVTEANNMDVPQKAENVAWYMYGPAPSEFGNAVIAGHYDTPTGRPAIFYHLRTLAAGDEIEVISINAVKSTFVVTEVASIPYDKFPNDFVFKTKPGKNLNLITCGGIWDKNKKIYSNRIVVYTTLKE